jgi:hypothetical protein
MKETLRHQEAFDYYYSLGDTRRLLKVSQKVGVAEATVKRWSTTFKWRSKIVARDKKNAAALAKKTDKAILKNSDKYVKIADAAIKIFAASLVGKVDKKCECGRTVSVPIPKAHISAFDFNSLVRLIRLETGEPDSHAEHKIIVEYRDPEPRVRPVESEVVDS